MSLRPVALFDFDGTLADTIPLIVQSFHHTLATSGLPEVDDEQARSWIGRPLQPVLEERFPGRGAELTQVYRDWNLAQHDALIERVPGMPELLESLTGNGIRLGVVSSKKAATVQQGLRVVGLDAHIEVLAGMDETARHKPDPQPLLFAAAKLGVDAADCVYVGDASVDVLAARAAGMLSVAVTWGAGTRAELEEAGADAIVTSVDDLGHLLLG